MAEPFVEIAKAFGRGSDAESCEVWTAAKERSPVRRPPIAEESR